MKAKALIISLVIALGSFTSLTAQSVKDITSTEVSNVIKQNKGIVILDVRTPDEFNSGHIAGAKNIDIRQADAINKIGALDKKSTYLVYCRTNNRSKAVSDYMIQNGFKNVYKVVDGIVGWNANALPLEK